MPTVTQFIEEKKRKQAGIDADPLARAAAASSPLLNLAKPDPVLVTTGPPPRLYSLTPKPTELQPPVKIISEDAALARLFPEVTVSTGEACSFRRDWMRLRIPSAVDPQGGKFYALAALDVLAPHAGALMAAEKEAAREAHALKIGRTWKAAKDEGLTDAEATARIAAIDAK